MTETPLCDALRGFAHTDPLRMHMPGHKGKPLPFPELSAAAPLDFTELPPTGDLFDPGPEDAIPAAEALWARAFGAERCLFLTGGSTQGVLTAFTLACSPGDEVLLDRGCHRSAYNALALLDLHPRYLFRPWRAEAGVTGPVEPAAVEAALTAHPTIRAVCPTSPTYHGVCSDTPALADVCRAHGARLIVDGAHGAHLPFLGDRSLAAADLTVVSAHKTLPAPGQSALLFSRGGFSQEALCRAGSLYGSSSPSYLLMAAMDAARAWMEDEGAAALRETVRQVARLRARFPSLRPEEMGAPLDPARLTLLCDDGFAVQEALEARGVWPEMADARHVVCICTSADAPADFARLEEALSTVLAGRPAPAEALDLPQPPEPEQVLSPRSARFASTERLPLRAAEGRVAAAQAAPYPPGIPVIAPGERITKKTIAYLSRIGYNMEKDMEVVRI